MPKKPLSPRAAALLDQLGMTEADVLPLALGGLGLKSGFPEQVFVGDRRVAQLKLPRLKKGRGDDRPHGEGEPLRGEAADLAAA